MRRFLILSVLLAASSHLAAAQNNYHALVYGYSSPSGIHWLPFADGDSIGTGIYQGYEIPTTEGFLPMAYTCTDTWTTHAGRRIGTYSGICTMIDDDGDWYRFFFTHPDPKAWEGTQTCIEGTGKYEGIRCDNVYYHGTALSGPGWFRGEKEGSYVLKN